MKVKSRVCSFAVIVTVIIISGCNPEMTPLKGKYPFTPLEITSTRSIDSIWLELTDLFVRNGLPVKKIEKDKGIIVSKKTTFISLYTFEDNDGHLKEPDAWVVLPTDIVNEKQWNPKVIYSQWSIQITKTENGTAIIKVHPLVVCTYYPNMFTKVETRGQSTGKLEELIGSFTHK